MKTSVILKNYAKRYPVTKSSLQNLKIFLNNIFRKQKVVMLHPGRCGSTVLGRMLNAHPDVSWAGEIFQKYMENEIKENTEGFVERAIESGGNLSISRVYGFETKTLPHQHLSEKSIDMEMEDYITLLRKLNFSKFIVLHRKNYIRRYISAQVGSRTKRMHSTEVATSPEKLTIDRSILDNFARLDESFDLLKILLQHDDVLFLSYEDDILDDPRIAYRKVCGFLGLTDESPDIELCRTNPFSLEDMVLNIEEVNTILKDTKYSWMLDA